MISKLISKLLITSFLTLVSFTVVASIAIPPPKVKAEGHILIDFHSGNILAEKNADKKLEPASLTKIMAAYVVFKELEEGNLKLEDKTTVSKNAWQTKGSRMFIQVNTQVSIKELLMGLIVQSGNDAGVALAEHIAGTEATFANLMNHHAKKLGMDASHFMNSTGLPHENHFTTARDIAKVTAATIREFPEFYSWYAIRSYKYNKIDQKNRNGLLYRDNSADGVKTGYTQAAGYCLVGSAKRDDTRLISVVLGTESTSARTKESQALLNYGFSFFESRKLHATGQPIDKAKVWKGEKETVSVGIIEDLFVSYPRRQKKALKSEIKLNEHIEAPVQKGQQLGELHVTLAGKVIKKVPVVAFEDVKPGSFFSRTADSLMLWIEK